MSVGAERVRVAGLALRCERFARLPSRRHAPAAAREGGARKKDCEAGENERGSKRSAVPRHRGARHHHGDGR